MHNLMLDSRIAVASPACESQCTSHGTLAPVNRGGMAPHRRTVTSSACRGCRQPLSVRGRASLGLFFRYYFGNNKFFHCLNSRVSSQVGAKNRNHSAEPAARTHPPHAFQLGSLTRFAWALHECNIRIPASDVMAKNWYSHYGAPRACSPPREPRRQQLKNGDTNRRKRGVRASWLTSLRGVS